ncbi:uncharacterized protein PAC_05449 [Phialocephala subalpina]|uniref:Major facilitator superfamily (MFS) profile domain-containing protein n=1 Tax=Phialocephala subalpina TaxID=576137 RepID=A0A1L7WS08_9HELO|nr:uncharacterized protein PAC_05449 [Phialocephala subalpina]
MGSSITPAKGRGAQVEEVENANMDEFKGQSQDPMILDFPEGGTRAWMAVAGAFLCLFVGGVEYSFGVFITYYSSHFLKDESVSNIAWVGSAAAFIHSTIGLLVGKLYDDGWFRQLIFVGSFLHVFCFMMLSLCTKFWQVWLAQGLGMGLATGILYQPALAIVSQYFERRRSLAMGIVMMGASTGGVIFPIIMNNTIARLGFGWGVRVGAFVMLGILTIANLCLKPRLSTRDMSGKAHLNMVLINEDILEDTPPAQLRGINYRQFFDLAFIVTTLGCFFIQMGTGFPYAYITSYATLEGQISPNLQFYLLPITFAGSAVGSPIMAGMADYVGVFNIVIISTIVSAGLQASIFGATTDGGAVAVSFLYGFMAAGFQSMMGPIYSKLSATVLEIGHRMGIGFFFIGIATLISSPIQGALLGSNPLTYIWWKPLVFSVLSLAIGVCFLVVSRFLLIRRWETVKMFLGVTRA